MISYIVKERRVDGIWRNGYGSGVKFTKWRTIAKFSTLEEATLKLREPLALIGLRQWVIFHKGKKVDEHGNIAVNTYGRARCGHGALDRGEQTDRLQEQNRRERKELWAHFSSRPEG